MEVDRASEVPERLHVRSSWARSSIENRFYFAPHGVALTIGDEPSNDFPYYSAERVRGGCGLVINSLNVYGKVAGFGSPYPEAHLPSFQAMAEAVHREGGKIFGQLWYFWEATGSWLPLTPPRPGLTPSPVQLFTSYYSSHALRRDEVKAFVDAYRRSAANLCRAGYDGVEVHVSHGTLLEQFISPYFNQRTDEYGGSRENRLRLVYECLEAARDGAGDGMAVGMRFNCDELLPGGYGMSEAARAAGGDLQVGAASTSSISTWPSSRSSSGSACRRSSSSSTCTSRMSRRCAAPSATCRC